jgi:hypothetical protein
MNSRTKSDQLKNAAVGIRVHSGWGAVIAVSGGREVIDVVDRRRITIIDSKMPGAFQPYHFSQKLELRAAQKHLADCAAISQRLAHQAASAMLAELHDRGYSISRAVILLSSGRPLPPLPEIFASHPVLHTAEGEFFRRSFWHAWELLGVPVIGIRERDLDSELQAVLGRAAPRLRRQIAAAGKRLGPPWTADQKLAALAAAVVLIAPTSRY